MEDFRRTLEDDLSRKRPFCDWTGKVIFLRRQVFVCPVEVLESLILITLCVFCRSIKREVCTTVPF